MFQRRPWPLGCGGCSILFLICAGLLIAAIVLFYLEEDWRGARDLADAKQRWQNAGYSVTASDYYPKPVPDDQNLAALPLFQIEPDPTNGNALECLNLRQADDTDKHGGTLQDTVKNTDLAALVAKAYATVFKGKTPPTSPLAQLEELYPFIPQLRDAAKTRPIFCLKQQLDYPNPLERPLGPVVSQISVAKLLASDAKLALRENQTQVALDDVHVAFELARGSATDPSLVGGLVSTGIVAITRPNITDALAQHSWNDTDLATIQDEWKSEDFLALFQFDLRTEAVVNSLRMYEWLKRQDDSMGLITSMSAGSPSAESSPMNALRFVWATGWWDMNAAMEANTMLECVQTADLHARTADPKRCEQISAQVDEGMKHPRPWNILFGIGVGPMTSALEKFAQAQVQVDEDRIVCGLERYRLAHGSYPPNLTALLDELPHDIMNGEPYHYSVYTDGTFKLYSVGWNQVDEGGAIVTQKDKPKTIDYKQGDWVWPMLIR